MSSRSLIMDALKNERGQGLVEYALILALIALVVFIPLTGLGNQLLTKFNEVLAGFGG